jgi:redox-sensing transcriptional repressor
MNTFSMNQLERYPIYLKYFKELQNEGIETISSPKIAAKLGYSEEQVRKDLQNVSLEPGRPKKGRSVRQLVDDIETFLGYRDSTSAVLVGCGHLGSALLNFPAFQEMGLEILAGFDTNVDLIGKEVAGKKIFSLDSMSEILPRLNAHIVIIAVPASAAQNVADMAIKAGAKGIWNFAPAHIDVPENVVIENVNLASSLAVLSHRLNQVLANEEKK